MSSILRTALLVAASALLFSGCASFNSTKPAPAQSQPIGVDFTAAELSGWTDLPIGTYRVPDSQVIISGHQKGGAAGLLFGVVGVAIQHSANKAGGKDAVKEAEDALRISLVEEGKMAVSALVSGEPFATKFKAGSAGVGPTISVSAAVVLTFINETEVRPFVVLKTKMPDTTRKTKGWSTRYIASSGAPRPLGGDSGWLTDGGTELRTTVSADLKKALEVMLRDVSSPFVRNESAMTTVEGHFPYVKAKLQTTGYQLGEDDASIYFIPKLGDVIVFAGVNIMPKSLTASRAMVKGDSPFKIIDDGKPKKEKKK